MAQAENDGQGSASISSRTLQRETSPFSDLGSDDGVVFMRMPTISRKEGVLRVVTASRILQGLGQVFGDNESWTQVAWTNPEEEQPNLVSLLSKHSLSQADLHDAADETYGQSKLALRVGTFVSHVWTSSRWRKHLALCYSLNVKLAVFLAVLTWALLVLGSIATWGIFGMGGFNFLLPLFVWIPTSVFLLTIFLGQHLVDEQDWWLDKLCIHQTRESLKAQGVQALPEIVATSRKMVILWDRTYFERLWCCAEVAIFCSTKSGAEDVNFVPLWLAPWVLMTVFTQVLCITIAERLFSLIGDVGAYLMTVPLVPSCMVPLVAQFLGVGVGFWLGSLPAVPLSFYAMRAKLQNHSSMRAALRQFDLKDTKCAIEEDRDEVLGLVSKLYRDSADPVHAFNSFVRKDLYKAVEEKVVGANAQLVRYRLCLLIFLPIAFSSAANVLGCDGIECYEAAVDEQGPGALPVQQMSTNSLAWIVGVFLVYPTSYPVMLRLMIAAEKLVGQKRPRTLAVAQVLAIVVAYAYMGFTEGLAAGLLNSTSSHLIHSGVEGSLPWLMSVVVFMSLLVTWNVLLFK